jgi:MSHA pilin protein MshA
MHAGLNRQSCTGDFDMDKAQKGFTLIELVVVITILGILAAFAFPRFAALEVEARTAVIDGLSGSVRAAASLAHSVDLVTTGAVTMEGNTIAMAFAYPAEAAGGIDNTLVDFTGFTYDGTATPGVFSMTDAPTPATCAVTYAEPTVANTPPIIGILIAGCQ